MKIRRLALAALAAFSSVSMAVAIAQSVNLPLPPYLTGTESSAAKQVFDVGMLRIARNSTLTAKSGGGQSGATLLSLGLNRFNVVGAGNDSAVLPAYSGGLMIVVVNATVTSMNVFPNSGGTINALSPDAAFAVTGGKTVIFFQANDGNWYANLTA